MRLHLHPHPIKHAPDIKSHSMDPPPRPSMDRFRIRVAVFSPEEAHNLEAVPKHTFVIARSQDFPLQDLPLRELRDVAIRRYKDIYPQES